MAKKKCPLIRLAISGKLIAMKEGRKVEILKFPSTKKALEAFKELSELLEKSQ